MPGLELAARAMRWLCSLALAACAAPPPQPAHAKPSSAAAPAEQGAPAEQIVPAEPPAPSCPRLPRAPRTWTGFAGDVPARSMYLALDALIPIQDALGALFCGPERGPCRPAALLSVELADESARAARVELDTGRAAPQVLQLRELNGEWQAEPESLAVFLKECRTSVQLERAHGPDL